MTSIEDGPPETPTASESAPQQDWEMELSTERRQLKEMAELLTSVMQTVRLTEKPHRVIAGYADELLRLHGQELPASAVEEIQKGKEELLRAEFTQQ
jgi:hypothetical protein